ncbi:Pseudouridylate synthase 7-like protein [Hypsibius exemplaris]|uniref:Pseudouridylate synthase 7-like protein n=1 Tax=Hypsibius exemplaris TaxID=2072580 RepID=A0A9X6NJ10_HYPEX|nr:Pseudouridylate synthase 7-like protein [Hypsibius exemplaris]
MDDSTIITAKSADDKENLFGITEFFDATGSGGFDGKLKTRISDFLVNEVDLAGNILHLTELRVTPELFKDDPVADDSSLDPEIKEKIKAFLAGSEKSIQIPAPLDKDARRVLHQQIEAHFPKDRLLRDPKVAADGSRVIEISKGDSKSHQMRRQDQTRNRRSVNDYIHFNLFKDNTDTAEAVSLIGGFLRVPPKCIQFAGTKDKRAKTVQKISIKHRDPHRLAQFSRPSVRIGNFSFEKEPLQLGSLSGNHFQLAMRGITETRENVERAVQRFALGGFINYFGLQRFGTTEVSTMAVGKALLKSDWTAAVELIMRPRDGDNEVLAKCRKIWAETKDAEKALRPIGRRHCIEADLLQGLLKSHEKDPFGAIQRIARNSRMIYVHSYQSYLWNLAVSYRIKTFGRKPVVGDLVIKPGTSDSAKRQKKGPESAEEVVSLTENCLDQFSIYDVVLPLPGFDVKFPDTPVTQFILDQMTIDGIDLREKHKVKDYSLSGSYRNIATKPSNFSWEIKKFDNPEQDLLLSDLDVLNKRQLPPISESGSQMALIINFTLPSSVYATMAIRELTKRSSDQRFGADGATKTAWKTEADESEVCLEEDDAAALDQA